MAIKDDIATFLRANLFVSRLNFAFATFKVYPLAYQKDVADAVASGRIKVITRGTRSAAVGATYDMKFDTLELSAAFNPAHPRDQAFLVHECTHAHLDMQDLGSHSAHEDEAVGYLAEAIFLEAAGQPPLGSEAVRVQAHKLALQVLAGTYWVSAADAAALTAEVARTPHYAATVLYESNAFRRGIMQRLLR